MGKVSKRQRQVQARRREVYRTLAATRKRSHGQLAHRVLSLGSTFQLGQISYRAWQKQFGRSVGRSAPGMFVSLLSRLAASAGGQVVELNTRKARLSQRCHCGAEETAAAALARVRLRGLCPAGPVSGPTWPVS
jgi:transposase